MSVESVAEGASAAKAAQGVSTAQVSLMKKQMQQEAQLADKLIQSAGAVTPGKGERINIKA